MSRSSDETLAVQRTEVFTKKMREAKTALQSDSTFLHSGLTGIVEMVYNRPATGHLVVILDNSTTAMTGLQENPATGRHLNLDPAYPVDLAGVCKALGVDHVDTVDTTVENDRFRELVKERLASNGVNVIIAKRPCILQMKKLAKLAKKETVK